MSDLYSVSTAGCGVSMMWMTEAEHAGSVDRSCGCLLIA